MILITTAARVLNQLKFWQKFLLIGLVMLIPLIVVTLAYLSTLNESMTTAEKKVEGAEYNVALKNVLLYSQQAGSLNVSLVTGNNAVQQDVQLAEQQVTEALNKVIKVEKNLKYDLTTAAQLEQISEHWTKLSEMEWDNPIDVQIEFDILNRSIISLMTEVANHSHLILATSPQYFNLVYDTTVRLPLITEQLVQMRSIGTDMINSGVVLEAQHDMIHSLYYPVQDTLKQMKASMDVTFENEELEQLLSSNYDDLNDNINQYTLLVNQLGHQTISIEQFYTTATAAIDSNYNFYTLSLDTLVESLTMSYKSLKSKLLNILIMCIAIILVATALFIGLYLSVRRSVGALEKAATEVAAGKLNTVVALHTKDEMKNVEIAFNDMIVQLNELVHQISSSAEQVSGSSEELNASAEEASASADQVAVAIGQMAKNAETQGISIKESSQAMDEMATGIQRIAENSGRVSTLTQETTTLANDGNLSVEKAFNQMETIKNAVIETSQKIEQLQKQSTHIGAIVNVITAISKQTNLLALNAAIEASRAGEHGKGFAVVAEEVRQLAEQSKHSAEQITTLIETIQQDTAQSVQLMNQVTQNVEIGIEVTEETALKFERIVESMQTLNPEMEEISATAVQFSAQTEQVVASMQQILKLAEETNKATSEIVGSSEEQLAVMGDVSASANTLSEMAESLQQLVSKFKL